MSTDLQRTEDEKQKAYQEKSQTLEGNLSLLLLSTPTLKRKSKIPVECRKEKHIYLLIKGSYLSVYNSGISKNAGDGFFQRVNLITGKSSL